uniref:Uncharacterized protein n=1 Tax=Lactuca sativa TaxID=4236 RepID=A0A9R1XV33_LACSA|nr:hypothetical protein LSAT_V11C200055680 [Lactuca sativa]
MPMYEKLQRWDDALKAYTAKYAQATSQRLILDATLVYLFQIPNSLDGEKGHKNYRNRGSILVLKKYERQDSTLLSWNLMQMVHIPCHSMHVARDGFTILHPGCYHGGDDLRSLLTSTLMVVVHQILVHLKSIVVLIGLLELGCHSGQHDACHFGSISFMGLIFSDLLRRNRQLGYLKLLV